MKATLAVVLLMATIPTAIHAAADEAVHGRSLRDIARSHGLTVAEVR